MEHIVQFGITIDDQAIQERIVANAEQAITEELALGVKRAIFQTRGSHNYPTTIPNGWLESKIEEVLLENKDAIIEAAATKLAEKIARTKKFREAVAEVVE